MDIEEADRPLSPKEKEQGVSQKRMKGEGEESWSIQRFNNFFLGFMISKSHERSHVLNKKILCEPERKIFASVDIKSFCFSMLLLLLLFNNT